MSIPNGARFGQYEIAALLGAGGMGEVYRARDTKLQRDVAIKVLQPAVATEPDRLARFEREARTLAALNHPHIAQIYGLEEAAGVSALVLELVEGPTLADQIANGPIAVHEAVAIATQIADALEAAHEHGIIHRDLKPANIKVRPDGTVKVLDFGLAKVLDATASGSAPALTLSPTLTSPPLMTGVGMLLGTAPYMAPEQVKGRPADRRSDVWAFGCVLFEMLTGTRAFPGDDVSDTLAAILRGEPAWSGLPADTSTNVRVLCHRCLEKDRNRRLRDIGDARLELESDRSEATGTSAAPRKTWAMRLARVALPASVGAVAALLVVVWWMRSRPAAVGFTRPLFFQITSADGVALDDPPVFSVSPDGQSILLRARDGGTPVWHVRSLTTGGARRLESTRSAGGMAIWSPDSRWVAFSKRGVLYKVTAEDARLQDNRIHTVGNGCRSERHLVHRWRNSPERSRNGHRYS